ncbi:MAG: 16S rRNA (adenine(1518)-N(6)/adenine(1519)-N(6))-dimethyltransferase RsmA [Gammaproteobacteria bacterium]|nr:16S rRNA (adenine(1518)-N(6)/adenine(1519)-N(6))-dimethyltransferase RsmA [Gammaproteobacteria bacterium]MDH5734902.1 16S rRNA (adenine(1518)-N(6)/adenine(1519)-N(6))-dimethyltransferase RsmA [Gammaproteobacteria bacterium]
MKHIARKRFGQNFLIDTSIIDRIIQSINPQVNNRLVEIGPGLGALTCPLLSVAGTLDVIELDRDIIPLLKKNCADKGDLTIHNQDVLKFDFHSLHRTNEKLRIIGNLPYNISTPIIFHLVKFSSIISDMHFMLQKEVVDRLAASPGNSDYGRLSVMTQYHFNVTPLFLVPPESFEPRPKVNSAIVRLRPHEKPPITVPDEQAFSDLVKQAFSQKRKTLRNTLKNRCSIEQLEAANIKPGQRAEELTLKQFSDLSNILHQP